MGYALPCPQGRVHQLAVLLGAGGVGLGLGRPMLGLLKTVAILAILGGAIVQVEARLMDGIDPTLVATEADAVICTVTGGIAITIRELRVRWIWHTLGAGLDLDVGCHPTSLSTRTTM